MILIEKRVECGMTLRYENMRLVALDVRVAASYEDDTRYTRIIRVNFKEDYAIDLPDKTSGMSIHWEGLLLGCLWLTHFHIIGLFCTLSSRL